MIYQQIAGFASDFLFELCNNNYQGIDWKNVLAFLSHFDIETNEELRLDSCIPETAVLSNLISRGIPTKASLFVENELCRKINWTKAEINRKIGTIRYVLNASGTANSDNILRCLCVIDPRLHPKTEIQDRLKFNIQTWERHPDPGAEDRFFYDVLPDIMGNEFILQLIEPQREIQNIIKFGYTENERFNIKYQNSLSDFYSQRVDFAVQFPRNTDMRENGMVIEIDGYQHEFPVQQNLDKLRDSTITQIGWQPTQRIRTTELNNIPQAIQENIRTYFNNPYSLLIKDNYLNPLFNGQEGLRALQLALSPIGVARIQKLILNLIDSNFLSLNQVKWNIAVVERDVPCADLAICDLVQQLRNLYKLEGFEKPIPEINIKLFNTNQFKDCELCHGLEYSELTKSMGELYFKADIVIDISLLQKRSFSELPNDFIVSLGNPKVFYIRSSYSPQKQREINCTKPIQYGSLLNENGYYINIKPIKYFIRNIFRKIGFRDGQIEILNRALKRKNVIALLPTGAGKSITYQLASLLQPGITLIIDPIKSLMKDQNDNLIDSGIDNTVFINSTIKETSERKNRIDKMVKGVFQFVFISPERLQIEEFREALLEMPNKEKYFSYCVIDEAHCVSEWGHDFRTAYLKLGANARKYCKTSDGIDIPILGLTGTASFDVLSDVRRELGLEDDPESIVRPRSSERKELKFHVIQANQAVAGQTNWERWRNYASAKNVSLLDLLMKMPSIYNMSINEFYSRNSYNTYCGLVFCPHKDSNYGVKEVSNLIARTIQQLSNLTGMYAGAFGNDENGAELLAKTQDDFKKNTISLLVATKAFGMGIDKPNIRYTIHFNMPHSIEAFYQEAGRAGRDKNEAYCYILYTGLPMTSEETIDNYLNLSFWNEAFKGEEKEKRIIFELLQQVTYPEKNKINEINELVSNEFPKLQIPIKLNNYFKGNVAWLYFNGPEYKQRIGYYNYQTDTIAVDVDGMNADENVCKDIMNEIIKYLKENKPTDINLRSWLSQTELPDPKDGIERLLENMVINSSQIVLDVGFENNMVKLMSDLLISYNQIYNQNWVKNNISFCNDYSSFRKKINANISENDNIRLSSFFKKIRTETDTYKAIYRLSIIGVIDEFSVDYKSRSIKIIFSKKHDTEYIRNLQNYISRYVSREKALQIPEEVLEREGQTVIQKCLGYLISFIYNNIARKRRQAINVMEEGCKLAIEKGNKEFQQFVNTYFDSKYYVQFSEFLNDYTIDQLFIFLLQTEGTKDNLLHLRGACDRLSIENPDNGMFCVLGATADLLLYDGGTKNVATEITKGWYLIKTNLKLSQKDFTASFSRYYEVVVGYNSIVKNHLNLEILRIHHKWVIDNSNKIKTLEYG